MLKDYDCTIKYHPCKANVVADALSQKLIGNLHYIHAIRMPILIELRRLNVEFEVDTLVSVLATLKVRPLLMERIAQAQRTDDKVLKWIKNVESRKNKDLSFNKQGVIMMGKRMYVPNKEELRRE